MSHIYVYAVPSSAIILFTLMRWRKILFTDLGSELNEIRTCDPLMPILLMEYWCKISEMDNKFSTLKTSCICLSFLSEGHVWLTVTGFKSTYCFKNKKAIASQLVAEGLKL